MNVICFGDSNTYGFDPRSYLGGRYSSDARWVDILAAKTGWTVQNQGMNGREIPRSPIEIPTSTDLLIVMLGGNDLLQGASPAGAAERMRNFLDGLTISKSKILLIGPPPIQLGSWVPTQDLVEDSYQLLQQFQSMAERSDIPFVSTADWDIPLAFDGVHFTEDGHRNFAENLYQHLWNERNREEVGL